MEEEEEQDGRGKPAMAAGGGGGAGGGRWSSLPALCGAARPEGSGRSGAWVEEERAQEEEE